jgi:uncharacterized protein YbjT (DUF2867 family)
VTALPPPPPIALSVRVAGGTGYLGRTVCPLLALRGHRVTLMVRPGSEARVPAGCVAVPGDPLRPESYRHAPDETLLLLVGTRRPAPWKAAQFEAVDFAAGAAAAAAVGERPAAHLVYLSVAHPAPAMHAYWRVRQRVEALLAGTAVPATFLRPWYVLGPGHRWAYLLAPLYALAERLPATRAGATRLGLLRLREMAAALVRAIEEPPGHGVRVLQVADLRRAAAGGPLPAPT